MMQSLNDYVFSFPEPARPNDRDTNKTKQSKTKQDKLKKKKKEGPRNKKFQKFSRRL